ncbi:MAG: V-type ATP synthase subunit D [Clostridiales bacterium]|jgi:V/A-type H+-transporting ATPase subunit D|nr:V-type ATP synthase subunit D [Clostridiales bacterium]
MAQTAPTKGNLISAKRSLALAQNGYELMDKKRNILIRELMSLIGRAGELQERIDNTFREAYESLALAKISMGDCDDIARAIPEDVSVRVRYRSVMGTELPTVTSTPTDVDVLPYGFTGTTSELDDAYKKFSAVKELILELAELENSIYRLAYSISKSQKRANALNNIVIPGLDADIARISDLLEEKDREEFVRLKVIKAQKSRRG